MRISREALSGLPPQLRDALIQLDRQTGLVRLSFMQDNLAASQTDAALLVAEVASAAGNAVDAATMPWPGSIVAITARTSAAATADTLTISPTLAGTKQTAPTLSITTLQLASATAPVGQIPFAAGGLVGVKITTGGSWDGTTADLLVDVYVRFQLGLSGF